ncbi:unnamed protein product [Phaedon cochleariae]|uniref:UBX domain-containing protein 4 n=1 Tax=Phaedon cochleariae TaxID=80249 RepID=A0A9P0GHL5_PHACE|nr:unnamed protein product [Phaedon cochleariae]
MKWYSGDIAQAIVFAKSRGAIFVVYIRGTDGQSEKITSLIENGELGSKLEQEYFVAIKLEAGSTPHQQFSEIYKEPSIPSIYFIGKNGAPLGIITGKDNLDMIPKRIDDILLKAGLIQNRPADISETLIQNEQLSESRNVLSENGANQSKPSHTEENANQSVENIQKEGNSEQTAEDKLNRAKELLEKKREQKLLEEKENERLKEIERRKMGQGVQQLKKWQEDQEMKQLKEDRDREKRENQVARERVLAQIAQDKAERLAKAQPQSPPEIQHQKASPPSASATINSNMTRLQFKLPDGSSNTREFAVSDSLESVVSYIKSNLKLPSNNFILSTTFPRRDFSNNDYSQSLLDLQLVPNAVILILPLNHGSVSTNPGGSITAMIWSLLAPLWNIFGFFRNFIFGMNPNAGGNKRPSDDAAEPRADQPKRRMRDSTVVKRQGNIHRLTDKRDSDDENNTWNGNSTQQM